MGEEDENYVRYMPQFDANRDKELMDTLPEYLTDEIDFAQSQSDKFYARVFKSLRE